jgi:hypothetical protein
MSIVINEAEVLEESETTEDIENEPSARIVFTSFVLRVPINKD